ncbi:MAG: alpha/beta hydrolase-fold protein [Planctomycetaceae bacterium]
MPRGMSFSAGMRAPLLVTAIALLSAAHVAGAGEVILKNGVTVRVRGRPIELETLEKRPPDRAEKDAIRDRPVVMLATPLKRVFVPRRQCESTNRDLDISPYEVFRLPVRKQAGASREIAEIHEYLEKPKSFDEFGRRTVMFREGPVYQQIAEITPDYLKIVALNSLWETALATTSVTDDVLESIIRQLVDSTSADQRLKVARFYIRASRFDLARRELASIRQDFPQFAKAVADADHELVQSRAQELLSELKLRRDAGQHHFVYDSCKRIEAGEAFPLETASPVVLRDLRELTKHYERAREQSEQAVSLMAELQAQLTPEERQKAVGPIRTEISDRLSYANLERLDSFLKLAPDPKLQPAEKLALAISGWMVGSAHAVTELDLALQLWQARSIVLDYLRTPEDGVAARQELLNQLGSREGVGATQVAQLLPWLPPALAAEGIEPGKPLRVAVRESADLASVAYQVLLPHEYHPDSRYPLVVALHGGRGPEQAVTFWKEQSQRNGYIVIAPEYADKPDQRQYEYTVAAHQVVLESLRDARRRFSVDSDRVFLAGHGMGGDAAFDMGFSHPDLFAGVVSIGGVSDRFCKFYWENARQLPLYVVNGELDRNTVDRNGRELMRMMQQNFNLIYVEYEGAGPDSFYSEIHRLFDWMSRLRRPSAPAVVEAKTLRPTDNRFHWYEFDGLPTTVSNVNWAGEKGRSVRPMSLSCKITDPGNSVVISSGAKQHRVWLAPREEGGLIDFDKRVTVQIHGRRQFYDFVRPDVGAMLERVRLEGDRQRLYWAVLRFPPP